MRSDRSFRDALRIGNTFAPASVAELLLDVFGLPELFCWGGETCGRPNRRPLTVPGDDGYRVSRLD